jgi:hypothetical protein
MLKLRWASAFIGVLLVFCEGVGGQDKPESTKEQVLFLTNANNDQQVAAAVGQRIEIGLPTIGTEGYGDPIISTPAIRFRNVASSKSQTLGGPAQIYIFEATEEGIAEIRIPSSRDSFSVTVQVVANGNSGQARMTPDQMNAAKWKGAWTNLVNDVRQTFRPTMPKLTAVEVNLTVANAGPEEEEVTLRVLDASGEVLETLTQSVPVSECGHTRFVFPEGGLAVTPGEEYSIRVSEENLVRFGWKYVVGGYKNGEASFNGRSLLPGSRSTFLFTTFGPN